MLCFTQGGGGGDLVLQKQKIKNRVPQGGWVGGGHFFLFSVRDQAFLHVLGTVFLRSLFSCWVKMAAKKSKPIRKEGQSMMDLYPRGVKLRVADVLFSDTTMLQFVVCTAV